MSQYETPLDTLNLISTAGSIRDRGIFRSVVGVVPPSGATVNWECVMRHLTRARMETCILATYRGMTEEIVACQLVIPFTKGKITEEHIQSSFGDSTRALVVACMLAGQDEGMHLYAEPQLSELVARVLHAGPRAMAIRLAIEIVNVFFAGDHMFDRLGSTILDQGRRWLKEATSMNDDGLSGLINLLKSTISS